MRSKIRIIICIGLFTCNRYFEGGASSVYLWELDDGGFAGVVLMQKSMQFLYKCLHAADNQMLLCSPYTFHP